MTTTTTKKPKIDFRAMLGDPEKIAPRSLREIADEVGTPFTAKAVLDHPDPDCYPESCGCNIVGKGDTITVFGRLPNGKIQYHSRFDYCQKFGGRVIPGDGTLRRWILLGHK